MKLSSPDIPQGGAVPSRFTCNGEDVSPQLDIEGAPSSARSLVLILDDFDAWLEPGGWGRTYDHWLVANIPGDTRRIPQGETPRGATVIRNHFGKENYGGPCPPSFRHLYTCRLYALDAVLDLDGVDSKETLVPRMQGHVLDSAMLFAFYEQARE